MLFLIFFILNYCLQNPNVVTIYGVAVLPPSVCILLELCHYGSLADLLKGKNGESQHYIRTGYADLLFLSLGAARGLAAVHALGADVIHRDVKGHNFLVDAHLNSKVADLELGIMRRNIADDSIQRKPTISGINDFSVRSAEDLLANWLPPELVADPTCAFQASDVFSFGSVLWEVITRGRVPFDHVRSQVDIRSRVGARFDVHYYIVNAHYLLLYFFRFLVESVLN
jgi:serine/threonine protein kinase